MKTNGTVQKIAALPDGKRLNRQPWLREGGEAAFPGDYAGTGDLTTDDLKALASRSTALEAALRELVEVVACCEYCGLDEDGQAGVAFSSARDLLKGNGEGENGEK